MVDYDPWKGNYTNTIVRNNRIAGGFATDQQDSASLPKGTNSEDVIIKSVFFPSDISTGAYSS